MATVSENIGGSGLLDNFDRLYLSYYSRLKRFVSSFSLRNEDAEDIVQSIFLYIWERRETIIIRKNLSSFLLTVAKNKCIDYIRKSSVEKQFKEECALKLEALYRIKDFDMSDLELESVLRRAVDDLPPRCGEIFKKIRFEGKSYNEIAGELGISESTVENQMAIALKKLRIKLKDYLPILVWVL